MTIRFRPSAGFTLIEMIMVITITGIIAGMVAVFITTPVQGYVDSVRRAELTDQADVALRRIARDVRLALPNSLRIMETDGTTTNAGTCQTAGYVCYIEFIPTRSGGRYRDTADGSSDPTPLTAPDCDATPTPADGPCFLDFTTAANRSFDVLGTLPEMAVNDHVVVFNLTTNNVAGQTDGNAYVGDNRAQISAINGNTVTLTANTFAAQSPPLQSPSARFQVVPNAEQAVTFMCATSAPADLRKFWNYGFNAAQAVPGGNPAVLAANATCQVEYQANATGRNGLLYIRLTLTNNGENVTLFNQIHVDNAP